MFYTSFPFKFIYCKYLVTRLLSSIHTYLKSSKITFTPPWNTISWRLYIYTLYYTLYLHFISILYIYNLYYTLYLHFISTFYIYTLYLQFILYFISTLHIYILYLYFFGVWFVLWRWPVRNLAEGRPCFITPYPAKVENMVSS